MRLPSCPSVIVGFSKNRVQARSTLIAFSRTASSSITFISRHVVHVLEEGYPSRTELCSRIGLEEVLLTYLAWTDAGTLGPLCFRVMASAPIPTASAVAAIARPYVASEYCIGSG